MNQMEQMAAARSAIPNFGVALFDNPRDMSSGWACRANDDPFPFNSVSDLSNDTLWVTSLDWTEYQRRAQKLSHLRRIDYLRSSLTAIASDLGFRITGAYAEESCAALARVLNQAMLIAIHTYKWDSPSSDLRGDVLSDDIRRILPSPPKAISYTNTKSALLAAYQSYSTPDWPQKFVPDSVTLTMRYNRLEYAKKIMGTLVPDDSWTYFPPEAVNNMNIDDLLNPEQPTLVEAAVELGSIDPEIASLISFGASTSARTSLRKWISQPELSWLSRHANVRVSSVLMARSSRPLSSGVELPARLISDPLFSLTVSAGLVAEAHWSAIATSTYNKTTRSAEVNSWTVWLRAADRAMSFALALKAHEHGFMVAGYGNGSIVVRVPRDSLKSCLAFADANDIFHPAFHQIFTEHGIEYE